MRKLAFVLVLVLGACASKPPSPERAVFDITVIYSGALAAAVAYESLPRCTETGPKLCSDPAVVAKLRQADATAKPVLDQAQQLVRGGLKGDTLDKAVETAIAAVLAFQQIVATDVLTVK